MNSAINSQNYKANTFDPLRKLKLFFKEIYMN